MAPDSESAGHGEVIAEVEERLSESYMACYVDTRAYDLYEAEECTSFGTSKKTIADFKLFTNDTPTSIVWLGHPECDGRTRCMVPIRLQQSVKLSATYGVNGIPLQSTATATYETSN